MKKRRLYNDKFSGTRTRDDWCGTRERKPAAGKLIARNPGRRPIKIIPVDVILEDAVVDMIEVYPVW
ncbi:MAG: hypothetical protein LBE09_04290 [Christensenellaceae bacterium]|nr:hypothetical protein [Christensenellaceae bacterium]